MAKTTTARQAMMNEIHDHQQEQKELEIATLARQSSVEAPSDWAIFKLTNTKRQGRVYIDGRGVAHHPERKKMEKVRLLVGEPNIWVEDQKHVTKEEAQRNVRSLIFEGKVCRINKVSDPAAYEFAKIINNNIDNPNRISGAKHEFFEWNPARQAEEAMKKRLKKVDAMKRALTEPLEKMRKHAIYLGITMADELGVPKDENAIRNDYVLKAEENPDRFLLSADSQEVEISYAIKKALSDTKIDIGKEPNSAYWADGGFITKIPRNRKTQEYLLELAMTNSDQGKQFLDRLNKLN